MDRVQSARAWTHVIGSLSGTTGAPVQTQYWSQASATHAGKSDCRWPSDVKIRIVERVTDSTVTVAWSHSCQGSFGAQVWRESVSHSAQVCAFSGDPIARGDAIYKPVRPAANSVTARLVILKMHLEALIAAQRLVETEALLSWRINRDR
jgi:hypothetical protein